MPLSWDDDDEEELTEIEYRRRPTGRVVVHDEVTSPMAEPYRPPSQASPSSPLQANQAPSPTLPRDKPHPSVSGLKPAPSRDRFTAFFIDTVVGFYLYLLTGYLISSFLEAPNLQVLHSNPTRMGIHLGSAILLWFFYYLLFEAIFGATLGKLFCRLRVLDISGRSPSLGNIFIRNFLRVVDYPFAFLIAVISMESSSLNQRLGDRAANTVVIKKTRPYVAEVNLQTTPLASTFSRVMSGIVDTIFSLSLVYGILLLLRPTQPFLNPTLFFTAPIAFLAYFTLCEFISGTTPGKVIFKRSVVLEHGRPPDGTASLLRNLFLPLDYILGYPLMVLSKKKQRLGDMAADTLVVVHSTGARGIWTSLGVLGILALVLWIGFKNPQSTIRKKYGNHPLKAFQVFVPTVPTVQAPKKAKPKPGKKPGKKEDEKEGAKLPATTSDKLKLAEFYFATGPEPTQIRHDRKFRQGDLIFLFFKIEGAGINDEQKVSLSEDLKVEDPDGKNVLNKPQIVLINKNIEGNETPEILFANNIQLPKNAPKGKYRVMITVFDQIAGTQYSFEKKFELQ
ncbi:MAG: RDD family protein [bacterium]|nr:RDD family protein [bacterium]